jgi:hypothetical protein
MSGRYDIIVEQGATFERQFQLQTDEGAVKDLTGWSATLTAREYPGASTALFTLTGTMGGTAGTIDLSMSHTATAALPDTHGYYELITTDGSGLKDRLLEGTVEVRPAITVP